MLPPIKIKLLDRDADMSLSNISPIKIRIREIKSTNDKQDSVPIKIKICDRNKNMEQAYQRRQAKVREKDGRIVVKYKEDILATDQILEYLSNDYIKPIRIKLSTLDLVYNWLYELLFKFNFLAYIRERYAIVVMYGKFFTKLFTKARIFDTFSYFWGSPRFILKFRDIIAEALDIFKVEGLRSAFKFKNVLHGFTSMTETIETKIVTHVPHISETIIYDIRPKTIVDMLGTEEVAGDKLGEFILGQSTLATGGNSIEDIIANNNIRGLLYKKVPRVE